MPSKPVASKPSGTPARSKRRFKPRELRLADGSRLVLTTGRSIDQVADDVTTIQSWAPEDADWPREAIRFGLHPQVGTVAPHGRQRGQMGTSRR